MNNKLGSEQKNILRGGVYLDMGKQFQSIYCCEPNPLFYLGSFCFNLGSLLFNYGLMLGSPWLTST